MFASKLSVLRWLPGRLNRPLFQAQSNVLKSSLFKCRFNSTQATVKPKGIKGLIQLYGYSALGVYLALTALDLPLCFLMVHSLGEEKMRVYLNSAKRVFGYGIEEEEVIEQVREKLARDEERKLSGELDHLSWWEKFKQSTLLAEFLIAYGIHKSLIVVRLPLTAAITPATVRILQRWGFNIGKPGMLKTLAHDAKVRYKSGKPGDFIKMNQADPKLSKQKYTKGQKWFNGLM